MITDRLSLNIALKYLKQFRENEGPIEDILFSYKDQLLPKRKTIKFPDIETLEAFINRYARLSDFNKIDCSPSHLYTIKGFKLSKNNTGKNMVYYGDDEYVTLSKNINKITVLNFNKGYGNIMEELKDAFNSIKLSEYILNQEFYIDCGYISTTNPEALEQLEQLYNKYKQL